MDEATIELIKIGATIALPFVAAGVVWVEKKLKAAMKAKGVSDEQGDIIYTMGMAVFNVIKSKVANDATKKALFDEAELILADMKNTWEDEAGTTEVLQAHLAKLQAILVKL
ncbi:MAG: hypothetical protein WC375_05265 [Methanomassiliicoccales archaeon]|jgi:hypothetical protein